MKIKKSINQKIRKGRNEMNEESSIAWEMLKEKKRENTILLIINIIEAITILVVLL